MDNLLEARALSVKIQKDKRSLAAVDSINFSIAPGGITGIVGESGCGKTLTALSITGLLPVGVNASGKILFSPDGKEKRDLLSLDDNELCKIRGKEISMIFQEPFSSLNPLKKIGAQITESLEIHSSNNSFKENRDKCISLMEKMGLEGAEKLMEVYPSMLSGGMCQRVMIAIAMINNPRLLIADEPATALDEKTQDQIIDLLKKINKDYNTAILFISHDLGLIKKICGQVLVMYAGRIMESGSIDEVFNNPAHAYTKGLLGCIPDKNQKGKKLAAIPGNVPAIEDEKPAGCVFWPRCGKAAESCKNEAPKELFLGGTHYAYCIGDE